MSDAALRPSISPLDEATWKTLAGKLRGGVDLPGSAGYETGRQVWNAMIDRRPAAVARCVGRADVQACVRFAREHGLPLTVKGGGHNIAGLAVADGALLVDVSAMRGVWVDPSARVAHAQGGCLLADVDGETQLHGLATVLGFVSLTGATGLTLGGGFGYLTSRFGWTVDNVLGMELVTADGALVRASADENADLFWALCGGGGNFGVVTGTDYRLHAVGPEILGGAIAWPGADAAAVLDFLRELMATAPPELAVALVLRIAPPAPWIDPAHHGKPVVLAVVCHSGALDDAVRDLAPLKSFGSPVGDVVQRRPYTSQQALLDTSQPKGRRYYWKSEYLPRLDEAMLQTARAHFARMPSPQSAVVFFPIGDAIASMPGDASAVGNRDARWVINVTAGWERREDDEANVEWARGTWAAMRPFSTGGTYVNFLTEEEGGERIRAAYGANLDRLAAVKRRWDPDNFFRGNKNIAPAAG